MGSFKNRFISLKIKIFILILVVGILVNFVTIFSVNRILTNIIDREYENKAEQISESVAKTLNPDDVAELKRVIINIYDEVDTENVIPSSEWGSDEWNEYMAHYEGIEELPVFKKIQDQLRLYQDINKVDCIYIMDYKNNVKHAIYYVDGAYDDENCPPGCVDSFENGIWPDEKDTVIPATITNEDVYGWLVTCGYAVMQGDNRVAFVCVDLSMNDIKQKEKDYLVNTAIVIFILTLILLILCLWYANTNITKPIIALSNTAMNYYSDENAIERHDFEKLNIVTHDEISLLLSSIQKMEQDMNNNIQNLISTENRLEETTKKAREMTETAMKDSLTSVGSKVAYERLVNKIEEDINAEPFGIIMVDLNFLKKINDTYGHDKGDIAIKTLCKIVCDVFAHSPVFRIGGDEFVVVVRNRDHKNVDNLIIELRERIDENTKIKTTPYEQVSAAVGYAEYNKNIDTNVESLFKRADANMYENKKKMKAERTD